ncbi:unnamed protein product, partial [Bubo scandiacus]
SCHYSTSYIRDVKDHTEFILAFIKLLCSEESISYTVIHPYLSGATVTKNIQYSSKL